MHRRNMETPDGHADWIFMREIQEKIKKSNEIHISLEIEVDFDERHKLCFTGSSSGRFLEGFQGFLPLRCAGLPGDLQRSGYCLYQGGSVALKRCCFCWKVMFWAK